jgi:glutamyl-tRNA reductase
MKRLYLIGVSHKTAPVEWRERLAVGADRVAPFHEGLRRAGVAEAVLLSTCNRVELYAVGDEAAEPSLRESLLGLHRDPGLAACLYARRDDDAVRHLFRVAAGLDSLVVGETEILGQVKKAYEASSAAAATGKLTNVLFQRALFVGKKVRTATAVSEGPTSVPALAASLAQRIFGDLRESRVLILGAGAMAEGTLHALISQKAGSVAVVNRTLEKAEALARAFKAEALSFDRLPAELERADIVLCSTGSPEPVVTLSMAREALARRRNRPLFFIDIAVPRDVEPAVETLDNAYLYNVDDLESLVAETLVRRKGEIEKAQSLADAEAGGFAGWYEAWKTGAAAALRHGSSRSLPAAGL